MKRHFFASFLALLTLNIAINSTQAIVVSLQPVLGGIYDLNYTPLPPFPGIYPPEPVIAQIDVMLEVRSLAPDEDGFGYAVFSVDLTSLCQCELEDVGVGWQPNSISVDTNGAAPGGLAPATPINIDAGNPDDLKGIIVQLPNDILLPTDPRRDIGEPGSILGVPYYVGSVFLQWNAKGLGIVALNDVTVGARNLQGTFVTGTVSSMDDLMLGNIECPEPSSLVILGGMLAAVGLRRRVN
jgi:hypothetical protein